MLMETAARKRQLRNKAALKKTATITAEAIMLFATISLARFYIAASSERAHRLMIAITS